MAFHKLEDHLRANDVEEQKRNRLRDAEIEAGMEPRTADLYGPYGGGVAGESNAWADSSQAALPLVSNAQAFSRGGNDAFEDDYYDDRKSFRTDDAASRYRGMGDETASNIGSESYAPSRNMFQSDVKKDLMEKEPLPGEVLEGEVAEEIKDTAARRRWVAFCWLLTWWVPTPLLTHLGRMKRLDVRQAWREKLAINVVIWFVCACAVFVIIFLGDVICPKEYVFNTSELASHSPTGSGKQFFTAVRGEVFDLTNIMDYHFSRVPVVSKKSMQAYAGTDATNLFPVQVRALVSSRRCVY